MKNTLISMLTAVLVSVGVQAQNVLYDGFVNPPQDARPRVWWHWMNGNISKDGIRKDLEWMHEAGIGGFHNFDAGLETPQIVDRRLVYMSEPWKDAFRYAVHLADSLGLEMTIASSPGWSETGGPWVQPGDGMKKLVWRELVLDGGRRFRGELPEPYTNRGSYQNELPDDGYEYDPVLDHIYGDIAVLAVRLPENERRMEELGLQVSSSDGGDCDCLHDDDYNTGREITADGDGYAWVLYSFDSPQTISSVSIARRGADRFNRRKCVEWSDDGVHFHESIPILPDAITKQYSFNIKPVTARYFRLRSLVRGETVNCSEFRLNTTGRVEIDTEKAGFYISGSMRDFYPTPSVADAIPFEDVIDITGCFQDGKLNWRVPRGRWKVIRLGWSLTGHTNAPASPEATGLEVDKFDRAAVLDYYDKYLSMYQDASGGALGKTISHIMIDSYEACCQNWTGYMETEFRKRRGYELRPWMPALTGLVICDADKTERFLADWRKTLGELIVENHYEAASQALERYGMKRHTESHEGFRAFVGDGMDVKRNADIPMSAFWTDTKVYSSYPMCEADIRESASVCHIYGQELCAAESFTDNGDSGMRAYSSHPGNLKKYADAAMACGLTRFVVHCSPHQPSDSHVPGLSLGCYGQWFTRHDTWASEARPWTDYLARSTWLLRQGRFVADIAYFYSENTNLTARFKSSRPQIPSGYAWDYVNSTALVEAISVGDGSLNTATGMEYRMLMIDEELRAVSMPVLRKIRDAAEAGVLVAGAEPVDYLDLMGSQEEFESLVRDIWHSGRKNVVPVADAALALRQAGVDMDFSTLAPDLRYVHRTLEDAELYWICNSSPEYRDVSVSFRVSGLKPQIWHADDAAVDDAPYADDGDRTVVSLKMSPDDAVFVVFARDGAQLPARAAYAGERELMRLDGQWTISFQSSLGAPEMVVTDSLASYPASDNPDIRHFSGTALYRKLFTYDNDSARVLLDLGKVCNMARVSVNGKDMGLLWKQPFRIEITDALKKGDNILEIKVINSWVNRLAGDCAFPSGRQTYLSYEYFRPDSPLEDAGLLGPVTVVGID